MQDQQKNLTLRAGGHGDYSCFDLLSPHTVRGTFYCSIVGLVVFLLSFVLAPYFAAETHAETASVGAAWNTISLELDTDVEATTSATSSVGEAGHGDILFGDIHPTSVGEGNLGTQVVIKKTIGVTTPGKFYKVYLSTASSSNALSRTFSSTESIIPAINNSSNGSSNAGSAFSDSAWGYALSSVVPDSKLGTELTKLNDSTIYNQDAWQPVPVFGSAVQIKANTTDALAGFSAGDTFPIYYGVMVDTDVLAGTYENQIVYTALASSDALDEVSRNITRSTYYVASGTEQTLSFDLSASVGGSSSTGNNASAIISADDITVYVVPHATIEASKDSNGNYTVTAAMRSAAELTKTGGTGGYQTCSFTADKLSITSNGAIIVCSMPEETILGDNDGEGYYDFWVHIEPYDYNYISRYTSQDSPETGNTVASVLYAGLQSKDENGIIFTEMQEMTAAVCQNTNRWGNSTELVQETVTDEETGEETLTLSLDATQVHLYDPTGETEIVTGVLKDGNPDGIGTFSLEDIRDEKAYLVRRLADDNCWMVQNLGLDLADFVETENLTSLNTDLNSKDVWDPGESMYEAAKTIDSTVTEEQTSYFPVISLDRLGAEQTYQFIPRGGGVGHFWGSKYYYDSETGLKTLGETVLDNEFAKMPRSYNDGDIWTDGSANEIGSTERSSGTPDNASQYVGLHYNYYSAIAESDSYTEDNVPMDSICPRGWQLPVGNSSEKSFRNLADSYDVLNSATNAQTHLMRAFPLSFVLGGFFPWRSGGTSSTSVGNNGYYWAASAGRWNAMTMYNFMSQRYIIVLNSYNKTDSLSVRCVAR